MAEDKKDEKKKPSGVKKYGAFQPQKTRKVRSA